VHTPLLVFDHVQLEANMSGIEVERQQHRLIFRRASHSCLQVLFESTLAFNGRMAMGMSHLDVSVSSDSASAIIGS
jgi:hypothetical protein